MNGLLFLLALTTHQTPPIPGVAIGSCVGGPASWYQFSNADLEYLEAHGIRNVSVGVPMTFQPDELKALLAKLAQAKFSVHIAPHFDGADETTWRYTIFDHPAKYIAVFQRICETIASGPQSVNSIELWNEAVDTRSTWKTYLALYRSTAPTLAKIARKTLPGVQVVLPLPIDQSPEQAKFFVTGNMVSFSYFRIADLVSGHVYPADHNPYPYTGGFDEISRRRDVLVQASEKVDRKLIITELGVAADSPGSNARMADTVRAYASAHVPVYLWLLHGNPGEYDLINHPDELSAAGGI